MDKELAESIGTAARAARHALKLTQEDAADSIGVSAEFYARIERGNALPSVPTLARICSALLVSGDVLLGQIRTSRGKDETKLRGSGAPPSDSPAVRRVIRRLRKASPSTLRLVSLLLKELEDQ